MLPSYAGHLAQASRSSLLPRYCAIFCLEHPLRKPVSFVVMTNAFAAANVIHERFDLKGSTVNRWASAREKAKGSRATLKDSDWAAAGRRLATAPTSSACASSGHRPASSAAGQPATSPEPDYYRPLSDGWVPSEKLAAAAAAQPDADARLVTGRHGYNRCSRDALERIVAADVAFLRKRGIFDYSLLVGVHRRGPVDGAERAPGLVVLESSAELQYICIIDALAEYTPKKRAQTFFLGTLCGGRDISCQPPNKYAQRFVTFVRNSMD